jgi:hypothetical protein
VVKNIGRGSYGHAVLMTRRDNASQEMQGQKGIGRSTVGSNTSSVYGTGCMSRSSDKTSLPQVFKIDADGGDSVLWEAFVHLEVSSDC